MNDDSKLISENDIEEQSLLGPEVSAFESESEITKEEVKERVKYTFSESKKTAGKLKREADEIYKKYKIKSREEELKKSSLQTAKNEAYKQLTRTTGQMAKEASKDITKASGEVFKDASKEAVKQGTEKGAGILFKTTAEAAAGSNLIIDAAMTGLEEAEKTIDAINPKERIKNVVKSVKIKEMVQGKSLGDSLSKTGMNVLTTVIFESVKWIGGAVFQFGKNMLLSLLPGGWAFYMLLMLLLPFILIGCIALVTVMGINKLSNDNPVDYSTTESVNLAEYRRTEMDKWCFMFPMDVGDGGFTDFSSRFAYRGWDNHNGMDICCPEGNTIYAISGGTVDIAFGDGGYHGGCGNYVMINHGTTYDGYTVKSRYLHMAQCYVSPGDKVEKGQPIGTVGHTGNTTGRHTCFALILWNGGTCYYYNPMLLWMHHANQVLAKRNGEFETWNLDSSYSHRATDLTHIRLLNGNQSLSNPYIAYW